jgi:ATP-binding cassette, subfamily B, bacterial
MMTNQPNSYWKLLRRYLRPQHVKVSFLALCLFSGIGLQLVSPQIMRDFINAVQAGSPLQTLTRTALVYLGVAFAQYTMRLAATYFSEDIGWATTNALRLDLAAHCLRLDLPFHHTHTPGGLIERVDGDVSNLANFFSQMVLNLLGNSLLLLGTLAVLSLEDWQLGLAFSLFAALVLFCLGSMREIATPHLQAERQASAELFGFIEERLSGTEDIRANGAGPYTLQRLLGLMRNLWRLDLAAYLKIARLRTTNFALFGLGGVLALLFGAYFFRRDEMTLGTVYLLYAYVQMLLRPMERLALDAQDFQKASASLGRVLALVHTGSVIEDKGTHLLPSGAFSVEFQNVLFSYPGNSANGSLQDHELTLQNLSFRLEPGKTLGLLGRTGSGKTTITRLLLRLYEPTAGVIRLNDLALRDIPLNDLRRRVAIVTQEVHLFNASVRDNLTLFDETLADEQLLMILDELGLGDWVQALPDGLDTRLLSGGNLSAGQAQLLAFARVFLHDPGLVILDEASARLDPATERLIERAITRLLKGRTALIIAHRLATLDRADELLILHEGQMVEHGERTRLLNNPASRFAGLLRQEWQGIAL